MRSLTAMQLIENTVVELFKKVRRKVGILRFILSGGSRCSRYKHIQGAHLGVFYKGTAM